MDVYFDVLEIEQATCNRVLSDFEVFEMRETAMKSQALDPKATRLNEEVYQMKNGKPVAAVLGLEDRLNVNSAKFHLLAAKGLEGIREELEELASVSSIDERNEILEWMCYVLDEPASEKEYYNGRRDKGRKSERLLDFATHENAMATGLTQPEVAALRIYTTHIYKYMNGPLRDDERYCRGEACPLPVTTHFAVQAIRKLRGLKADRIFPITLWRGMRNRAIADNFQGAGGTELAFMSTTSSLEVAVRYSLSRESLLLKFVVPDFLSVGADLQWLSAFPSEAEILFPPLTYLKPSGSTQKVTLQHGGEQLRFTFVEVAPILG